MHPTRSAPNPTQGPPMASRPHSHHQAAAKQNQPRRDPGLHPPTDKNHHGNHTRSEHREAQTTDNPNLRTKINPRLRVATTQAQTVLDTSTALATSPPPHHHHHHHHHHRQDHTAGKEQLPHQDEAERPKRHTTAMAARN